MDRARRVGSAAAAAGVIVMAGALPSAAQAQVGQSFGQYTVRSITVDQSVPATTPALDAMYQVVLDVRGLGVTAAAPLTVTAQRVPSSAYTTAGLLTRGHVSLSLGAVRVRSAASAAPAVQSSVDCLRGRLAAPSDGYSRPALVSVLPGGSGTVAVTAYVAQGLAGMVAPQITLSSGAWRADDGTPAPAGPDLAPAASLTVKLPQPLLPQSAVALKVQKVSGNKVRLIGRVLPARKGTKVTIVGRSKVRVASHVTTDLLDLEVAGLGQMDAGVRRLATATTRAGGRFAVWVKGKPGAVFVARAEGLKNKAFAGASCPVVAKK